MSAELERLVHDYLDGTIAVADLAKLSALLCDDAEARREFAEWMNLDSAIAALAAGWEPRRVVAPRRNWSMTSAAVRWFAAAAACVAMMLGGALWWQSSRAVFATVVEGAGVAEMHDGAAMRGETHRIAAGTVQLVTAKGARVVIEAPADFRFESAQRLHLRLGRLAADVPPTAKGFTVVTPSGDAVDLGTRFGVDVPLGAAAEIHVFQGEVIAKASGAARRQSLRGGDAVTLDRGASASRGLRSSAFIQPDELPGLTAALAAGQRARSDTALAKLRRDPALIALLDFESETHTGTFRTAQGRWPGSRAPEFVSVGDHLKLDVGGERAWPQLTLAAWVRIDRLGEPYQSLYHTDGWSADRAGQVHWMIIEDTTMRLALRQNTLAPGSSEQHGYPDSRTPVLPEQGRWAHLAVVYDSEARTVRFYLNGKFDKETRQEIAHPARLGPAQIGNWDSKDRKLSGRVDEMLLLGRAMSDAEVRALYDAGNPYR